MRKFVEKNSKWICVSLTLLWVCVIFSFSLQPGDVSSDLSQGFGKWLVETFLGGFIEYFETMPQESVEFWHFVLRKCGHFSEYLILGVLTALSVLQMKLRYRGGVGMTFCVFVASVDETIQLFVSGRSGQISDVALDSVGALVGVMMVLVGNAKLWYTYIIKKFGGQF